MKNKHIFLALLLMITSMPQLYAMRRTVGLTQQLLGMRQVQLAARSLPSTRSYSTAPKLPHQNWFDHICYKQIKAEPTSKESHDLLEEQCDYTKQTLLKIATQDTDLPPLAFVALLEAGANLNEPDCAGQTPLHLLAIHCKNRFDESSLIAILAYIAVFNPDFGAVDSQGKIPADYAPEGMRDLFAPHQPICPTKLRYIYRH